MFSLFKKQPHSAHWINSCKAHITITKKEKGEADLLVFFGHPLVPAVEHLQPFCLSLPQHVNGNFFSTVEIRDNVRDNSKQILFTPTNNGYTVLCHFPVLMTGESCHQGGGTVAHLFLIHTGNLTSDQTLEHLPTAAKYKENRKLWESFPLVQFLTTSYTKHMPVLLGKQI